MYRIKIGGFLLSKEFSVMCVHSVSKEWAKYKVTLAWDTY